MSETPGRGHGAPSAADVLARLREPRALVVMSRPCVDVRLEVDRIPGPGAKTLVRSSTTLAGGVEGNFAAGLARAGVRVTAVGSGSADPIAEVDRASLREHGVDVRWDEGSAGAPTVCHVLVDPDGERAVLVDFPAADDARITAGVLRAIRSATDAATHAEDAPGGVAGAPATAEPWDLAYLGVLRPVHREVLPLVRPAARTVVTTLEAGEFPGPWLDEVAGGLDVVLTADETLTPHRDRVLDAARRHGWTLVVTAGADGCTLHSPDGRTVHQAAADPGGPVVDTTGAGDAFAAGLGAALLAGLSPAAALAPAAWFAAQAVRGTGPRTFPTTAAFAEQLARAAARGTFREESAGR